MAIEAQVDGLLGKIGDALERLLTLDIQTVIAPMGVQKAADGDWTLSPNPGKAVEGITTRIRLEQGDIQNAMSEGAITNSKLMEIHSKQVELSRQIVAENVKALVELAQSLIR